MLFSSSAADPSHYNLPLFADSEKHFALAESRKYLLLLV